MKGGNGIVFCHIDLVQHAEAAELGALIHRPLAEPHLVGLKGVGADEGGAVCVHMEGNVIGRTAKNPGKGFAEDIFAGGLAAGEQQVFAL